MAEKRRNPGLVGEESGVALILTVLILLLFLGQGMSVSWMILGLVMLLVSAIGVSALNRAGDEKAISTASRRQIANLAAADAGLRVVRAKLESVAGSSAALNQSIEIDDTSMFLDPHSNLPTHIRTGTIGGGVDTIEQLGTGGIEAGDELSVGANQASTRRAVYRVNITATDPSGGNTQVQAQFSVAVPNS